MDKNVTYKALLYILLGSVSGLLAFTINANSKFDQIQENTVRIEKSNNRHVEDLKAVYIKLDKNDETIKENQIEVIKGIARLELLIEKKYNVQN